MKIGYISDLHIEFHRDGTFEDSCIEHFNMLDLDFLIIAGDIHSDRKKRQKFLDRITIPYKYVHGNHDYFKQEVHDDFFDEDGICGGTLWTNFNENPFVEIQAKSNIWDFKYIPNWTTAQCKFVFYEQWRKIMQSPSEIVVTHFPPSQRSITERFKNDPLSEYFCNNMDKFILDSNKKLWIHGHVHSDHDYMIGDCRVVCNPVGYPGELRKYQAVKIIEI